MNRAGHHLARAAWRVRVGRLVDLIGPAAFPAAYLATHSFTVATWATTAGAGLALALRFALDGRLALLSVVSGVMALATGGLSLAFGSEAVLEAKPTVIHLAIGLGLLVAWILDGAPAKALFGGVLALADRAWAPLCLRFGLFALAMAIANEVIRRAEPTWAWALFHFPGQLLLHLLFLVTQVPLILVPRVPPSGAVTD